MLSARERRLRKQILVSNELLVLTIQHIDWCQMAQKG